MLNERFIQAEIDYRRTRLRQAWLPRRRRRIQRAEWAPTEPGRPNESLG